MIFFRKIQEKIDAIIAPAGRAAAVFERVAMLVPVFYYFLLFIAFSRLEGLSDALRHTPGSVTLLWPLAWARGFSFEAETTIVFVLCTLLAFLGAVWWREPWARTCAFVGLLFYHAHLNSIAVNHQWDLWLWISFLFLFLPRFSSSMDADAQRKASLVFWYAQTFILLTYTMAGLNKLGTGVSQWLSGSASIFSPDSAALFVSTMSISMHGNAPLAAFVLSFPLLGWLLLLLVVYLQEGSLLIAFRPELHRLWGAALILFQIGTYLFMWAVFVPHVPLLAIFLLSSPFQHTPLLCLDAVRALPLAGFFRRLLPR